MLTCVFLLIFIMRSVFLLLHTCGCDRCEASMQGSEHLFLQQPLGFRSRNVRVFPTLLLQQPHHQFYSGLFSLHYSNSSSGYRTRWHDPTLFMAFDLVLPFVNPSILSTAYCSPRPSVNVLVGGQNCQIRRRTGSEGAGGRHPAACPTVEDPPWTNTSLPGGVLGMFWLTSVTICLAAVHATWP